MGRFLHPNLQKLEDLRPALTYKGWEVDYRDAEDAHSQSHYALDFPKTLRKLKVRQKLHEGDRSHPRLVKLDAIIQNGLNYPGWEVDVKQVETMHAEVPYMPRSDVCFNSKLRRLEYAQLMHSKVDDEEEDDDETTTTSSSCYDDDDDESSYRHSLSLMTLSPPSINRWKQKQSATTTKPTSPRARKLETSSDCSSSSFLSPSAAGSAMGECVICGDEARTRAFIPCGHLCTCCECASKVMRRTSKCPVCQGSATETVQIFLP